MSWSVWGPFSDCQFSCGIGTINRNRTCINGTAGSEGCPGEDTESRTCFERVSIVKYHKPKTFLKFYDKIKFLLYDLKPQFANLAEFKKVALNTSMIMEISFSQSINVVPYQLLDSVTILA